MRKEGEDAGPTRAAAGNRSRRSTKAIALDPRTYEVLVRLMARRGFRSLDELLEDMARVYLGLPPRGGEESKSKG